MSTYLFVYFGSVLLATLCTPLVIFVAKSLNIYDDINVRKVHSKSIPRVGGITIVLAMLGMTIPVLMLNNLIGESFRSVRFEIIVLLAGSVLIFAIGLIDDLCRLRVRTKFLAQLLAAVLVCSFGIRIEHISLVNWFTLDFGWISWPVTILWIVGITNAVNFTDGLDGLAAGISAITCGVIAVFAIYSGQAVMAVLMLALLGSLTGFLFFNFNPAKIFMGDCGSLFLGFILATSSILCATKSATFVSLALPALALGIPIFDTLFSILRRFLERRSIFSPDRSHFHHRLLDMGFHQRHVVLIIYMLTFTIAGLGMFMMATRNTGTIVIFICDMILLILTFRIFGAVRLSEIIDKLQYNRCLTIQSQGDKRDFENAQLQLRMSSTFEQWWQGLQSAAERMECAWVKLPLRGRDGTQRTLLWRGEGPEPEPEKLLEMTLPLRQRRANETLRIVVAVQVNGSLESAGNRAALFSRLINEHSLEELNSSGSPESGRRGRWAQEPIGHDGLKSSKRQYSAVMAGVKCNSNWIKSN